MDNDLCEGVFDDMIHNLLGEVSFNPNTKNVDFTGGDMTANDLDYKENLPQSYLDKVLPMWQKSLVFVDILERPTPVSIWRSTIPLDSIGIVDLIEEIISPKMFRFRITFPLSPRSQRAITLVNIPWERMRSKSTIMCFLSIGKAIVRFGRRSVQMELPGVMLWRV